MDEAEKYQQRLQAIVERRRQQEEEERVRRETEEERLKLAQKKRKSLRDHWLSEPTPAPAPPSADPVRLHPSPQDRPDTTEKQTKSQKTPEEEEEEAADVRKEKNKAAREHKESANCTGTATTHNHCQASVKEEAHKQVSKALEDYIPAKMTQRMFHESGQDGRSVLGMVAIQVERDPKTGSSVIRSVAPMSAPADAALATTVFDDGRKSVHTFGATEGQPSAEELGQILSAVDGVGMKVLLDEVTVTPPRGKISTEIVEERGTPEEKKAEALSYFTHPAVPQQNKGPVQVSMTHDPGAEPESVDCRHKDKDEQKGGDAGVMLQGMRKLDNVDERVAESRMEEGPITLRFLGYADALSGQGEGQGVCLGLEDNGDVLTVERVIITDEGEEKSVTPPSSASPAATSVFGPGCHTSSQDLKDSVVSNGDRNIDNDLNLRGEAGKESKVEEFQNIPLDENGAKPQGEEGDNGLDNPASPSEAPAADKSKQKTCQCCTVM